VGELGSRDEQRHDASGRRLKQRAQRFGVDLMVQRVVIASEFRIAADDVRWRWTLHGLIETCVMMDYVEAERARHAPKTEGAPHG
jgi:hypothetical protein